MTLILEGNWLRRQNICAIVGVGERERGMSEDKKALMLLEFMFGDAAKTAQHGAFPDQASRILCGTGLDRLPYRVRDRFWAEAFNEWLAERGEKYTPSVTKQAKQTPSQ
jgi:hypothetical protein